MPQPLAALFGRAPLVGRGGRVMVAGLPHDDDPETGPAVVCRVKRGLAGVPVTGRPSTMTGGVEEVRRGCAGGLP